MTVYVVKRGTDPAAGISLRTTNKDYAEGFAAGLNHTGKKYWHRVETVDAVTVNAWQVRADLVSEG